MDHPADILCVHDISQGLTDAGIDYKLRGTPEGSCLVLAGGIVAGPATTETGQEAPGVDWTIYADPDDLGGEVASQGHAETLAEFVAEMRRLAR